MKTASTEREAIVAEVVTKLTEDERKSIGRTDLSPFDYFMKNRRLLYRFGLVESVIIEGGTLTQLNETGLAIRDHLKDQDHGRA